MTEDEALAVAKIMMTADGGCSYCARELATAFYAEFPQHLSAINEALKMAGFNDLEPRLPPGALIITRE